MSKARALAGQSRHARESSPRADEFYTVDSDFAPEHELHSTEQFGATDREQHSTHWSKYKPQAPTDDEGSASMSIEIGRGYKRAGDMLDDDNSSNAPFTLGAGDSQYSVTGTPPIKSTAVQRKNESNMRRDASLRRANEGAKRSVSQNARVITGLSEAIRANQRAEDTSEVEVIVNAKNTRFTHKKIIPAAAPSGQMNTPARPIIPQSVADTATSFVLPDVSNIGELIDPVPKDMTSRVLPGRNQSRFTPSASYRMPVRFEGTDRLPLRSVPIPEDEKMIYAALQTLQEKFNQLETDNAEAAKQLDLCEKENIELRNALAREEQLRRPDSALGSEDGTAKEKWRLDRTKLQSTLRSVQQRFDKMEHKLKLRESDLRACTKEKDDLITQLGVECYRLQELESENAALRHDHDSLRAEVDVLKQELYDQRQPIRRSLAKELTSTSTRHIDTNSRKQSARFVKPSLKDTTAQSVDVARSYGINFDTLDQQARQHIADVVKQQWQRQQDHRRANKQSGKNSQSMFDIETRPVRAHYASTAPTRKSYSATIEDQDATEEEVYTEFEFTNTKNYTDRLDHAGEATADMTDLTPNDPLQVKSLRQTLEEQRRAAHQKRHSSAPLLSQQVQPESQAHRRSSMRDVTAQGDMPDLTKAARTVRVQSPPAVDETNMSLPSNIGRRRNSNTREEGETSAFIIPDITLHRKNSLRTLDAEIIAAHDVPACTVCTNADVESMEVPELIPISTRTDLPVDATVRPSQPPRNALARVLKQLNDELAHLKLTLADYQKQHNSNDPTVGARARKNLYDKINELLTKCKRKEDQIYALYDAVEGQLGVHEAQYSDVKQRMATPAAVRTTNVKTNPVQPVQMMGFDGAFDLHSDNESIGLPAWEGLSDDEDA